jgi:hypothetical protein
LCPRRYNWNIVESGVKYHQSNQIFALPGDTWTFILKCIVFTVRNYRIEFMCICYYTISKISFWATKDSLTLPHIGQGSERSCIYIFFFILFIVLSIFLFTTVYKWYWATGYAYTRPLTNSNKIPHCRNISKFQLNNCKNSKIDTPNTQIHQRLLSLLGTVTSIKWNGVKLVLWLITPKATPSDNQHNDDEDRFDISVLPDFGD